MTPPPLVRFEAIYRKYTGGKYAAVDGIDLDLEEGSFVTLLGPSGCGKTTTLRVLGGFETPDAGRVLLEGKDVTRLPPNRRNVNMVFQDYALFPHLTVAQNIAFGLQFKDLTRRIIADRVEELLHLVDLGGFGDRKPSKLSGGQKQRVALARALAPDPVVLLLDEPLAALDAKLREQMQFELKALQQRTGKTFLFVTHDQEEALALSDRIVVMNRGRIEQSGTPEDLYYRPATNFVADFVGTSSRLSGQITQVAAGFAEIEGNGFRLKGRTMVNLEAGARAVAFVRPETLRISDNAGSSSQARLLGRAFVGGRTLLELRLPDGTKVTASQPSNLPEPELGLQVGFDVAPEHVLLFAA